jgi:hypothetical protein
MTGPCVDRPDVFDTSAESFRARELAKHICSRCPILMDCRSWLLATGADVGGAVCGGLTGPEVTGFVS